MYFTQVGSLSTVGLCQGLILGSNTVQHLYKLSDDRIESIFFNFTADADADWVMMWIHRRESHIREKFWHLERVGRKEQSEDKCKVLYWGDNKTTQDRLGSVWWGNSLTERDQRFLMDSKLDMILQCTAAVSMAKSWRTCLSWRKTEGVRSLLQWREGSRDSLLFSPPCQGSEGM